MVAAAAGQMNECVSRADEVSKITSEQTSFLRGVSIGLLIYWVYTCPVVHSGQKATLWS